MMAAALVISMGIIFVAQLILPSPQDIHTFYTWYQLAFERGIFHIYDWTSQEVLIRYQEFSPNYPPFIFSLYPFAALLKSFGLWPSWPSVGANLFFRIPLILGQVFVCFAIFRKLKEKTPNLSNPWALILLFLNPAFLLAGPVWGQLNFLLWGTLALSGLEWDKDRPMASAAWAALGATIKPQFVMFLPLLGFLVVKKRSVAFASKWVATFLVGVVLFCSPFMLTSGLDCLAKGYIRLTGGQYGVADIGYNFWWTLFRGVSILSSGEKFFGVPYAMVATLLGNGLVVIWGYLFCFKKFEMDWMALAAYTLLTLFCFLPGMNPLCLLFGLGFLSLLAIKNPNYRIPALLLSLIQCVNLGFNALWSPNTRFYLALPEPLCKLLGIACFLGVLWVLFVIVSQSIFEPLERTEMSQRTG